MPWALRSAASRGAVLPPPRADAHRSRPAAPGDRLRARRARVARIPGSNMFLNVMTPLIMVISFSDNVQPAVRGARSG